MVIRAAHVEEEFRLFEIPSVRSRLIEPDERHFDDLVSGRVAPCIRPERVHDEIGRFDSDVEKRALSGRLIMRNTRFE